MYVARVPNRKSPPAYLLRESYREGGQVKNRTLANISHLPLGQIQLLSRVLKGERLVPSNEAFRITGSLPHGHVQAVVEMIDHLQLPQLIGSRRSRQRDLVLALIVQRIVHPSSKLAATRLWKRSTLAEELKVVDADEDMLTVELDENEVVIEWVEIDAPTLVSLGLQVLEKPSVEFGRESWRV